MKLEEYTLTWGLWLFAVVAIVALYFALRLIAGTLNRVNVLGRIQRRIQSILYIALKLYEPLAILFLMVGFISINPLLHGLLVGFSLLLGYNPIKNYLNGRLFLLAHQLKEGQRIYVHESNGLIRRLGRLGISLQTEEGIRFVNYTTILSDGYMLLQGEQIGRLHRLSIQPKTENEVLNISDLQNKLFSCPYIDWSLRPEIHKDTTVEGKYILQVLVREDQHLQYLMDLIGEWGGKSMNE